MYRLCKSRITCHERIVHACREIMDVRVGELRKRSDRTLHFFPVNETCGEGRKKRKKKEFISEKFPNIPLCSSFTPVQQYIRTCHGHACNSDYRKPSDRHPPRTRQSACRRGCNANNTHSCTVCTDDPLATSGP